MSSILFSCAVFGCFVFIITCSPNLVVEGCIILLFFVGNKGGWLKNYGGGSGEGGGSCGNEKKLLNVGDSGGGGIKLLNDDGGGDRSSLLLLSLLLLSFLSGFNLFYQMPSIPAGGAFLTRSLARSFLPTSASFRKDPSIGFCASNVEIS